MEEQDLPADSQSRTIEGLSLGRVSDS